MTRPVGFEAAEATWSAGRRATGGSVVEPGARIGEQGPPPDRQYLLHLHPLDHLDQVDQADNIEQQDLVLQRKFSERDKKKGKIREKLKVSFLPVAECPGQMCPQLPAPPNFLLPPSFGGDEMQLLLFST